MNRAGDGWHAANDPEADPAPFTTVAWRLWHVWDCFESYSERAFNSRCSDLPYDRFVGEPSEAIGMVAAAIDHFTTMLGNMGAAVAREIGPDFGPFAERNYVDLGLHALRELNCHGAEVALLRDLWHHRLD